ncbi:regulatory LuxR family protein [Actinoplanes italicus]|uniref:Regulatory LuxR family protein n=1 Tax=Actinoplanes italicus TaxID=113567 RepID=A0A2T0KGN8_9ACTN|nr:regulatory LuxR family protein [Actinoplanes italicus]
MLFLTGEAGIGKTRLATDAMVAARDAGLRVLRGRATSGTAQYRALREAFMPALRHTGPPDDPQLRPYRAALSRLLPEWRPDDRAATGSSGPDDAPVVLAEGVLRLLTALARLAAARPAEPPVGAARASGPPRDAVGACGPARAAGDGGGRGCVLVLEDLHDADTDTLAVLDYLVDHLDGEPVLVIATVRPGANPGMTLIRAATRRRAATVLELGRLGGGEVRELAAQCLGVTPDRVPEPALGRLIEAADGIPFHIEELVAGMVDDQALVVEADGWRAREPWQPRLPPGLAAGIAVRADHLGPPARALLRAAALIGHRFPSGIAAVAAGLPAGDMANCLRLATDAQLINPTGRPGEYAFRHALTAEALRSTLLPAESADLARRAASALDGWEPGPRSGQAGRVPAVEGREPGPWPGEGDAELAARLWLQAGEAKRAARLLGELAERARLQGAASTAVVQAGRALATLDGEPEGDPTVVDLRTILLDALVDAGEMERAAEEGARLDLHAGAGRRAAVHLRLAKAASTAGRWADGLREIAMVRALDPGPELAAEADAVEAFLVFLNPAPDRMSRAGHLAERALRAAASPEVRCAALEVLAGCARSRDLGASRAFSERALAIAEEHGLTGHRLRMLFHLGVLDGIHEANPARLVFAHAAAVTAGAVVTALIIECELVVVHLTRGEFGEAERRARHVEEAAGRLRLPATRLIALAFRVCVAGHRGIKDETEQLYGRFSALGGAGTDHAAAVWGLGLAFEAIMDEDRERAWHWLDRAIAKEDDLPPHYLSFNRGPHLLLAVLSGKAGRAEADALAGSAHGQARWNRQFVLLSRAILDGREGLAADAVAGVAAFEELASPYPLARNWGLRLIGESAYTDGWGRPREWLTVAEAWFHDAGAARVAASCRHLLRAMGVPLPQRRRGSDRIPPALRKAGVTVRELEVLELVAQRLGNREIAARLFLSPRTVEKHVASLLLKTGRRDRAALARLENMGGPGTNMG